MASDGPQSVVPVASAAYISELDGLRAIAVGIVVVAHYRLVPLIPGGFGVTLFFFLSGYLITTLFFAEYKQTQAISIVRFYMRRWLRLTPPLLISIALGVAFYQITRVGAGGTPTPFGTTLAALFYYTNYYDLYWHLDPAFVIPFGICWSLAVEEHFYLLWPWIIRQGVMQPPRLCMVTASLCLVVLCWRIAAYYVLHVSQDYTYMASDCRIDSILYGALLRGLFEVQTARPILALLRRRLCVLGALGALMLTFILRDESFRNTMRYTVQGLALMPVFTSILSARPEGLVRRTLSAPPLVLIGRLSYSIYLFHLLARTPGEAYFGTPFAPGAVISGLALTAFIAWTVNVGVERPMAQCRRRLRSRSCRDDTSLPSLRSGERDLANQLIP